MGAVLNAKRTGEASTPEVAKLALTMKTSDVKDFASTKHKGLPEKKKVEEGVMDIVRKYSKKKESKKPQKAQDAGARARRVLKRREYKDIVSSIVPSELEDHKISKYYLTNQ